MEIEAEQEGLVRPMEKDPTISRQQINPDNTTLGCFFPWLGQVPLATTKPAINKITKTQS